MTFREVVNDIREVDPALRSNHQKCCCPFAIGTHFRLCGEWIEVLVKERILRSRQTKELPTRRDEILRTPETTTTKVLQ